MNAQHKQQRCLKCGGKLFLYNDCDGWYEQCLQCSYLIYLDVIYKNGGKVYSDTTSEIGQSPRARKEMTIFGGEAMRKL
ncbi:MAG: hypothetical protein AMJ70_06225 [Dehalococcoidia bacterium SG8_51_3]|nr:MAG: hypothetical protein AMJ70_06225 [Dehalococcoidia bacterium SG8_51_3]